MDCKTCKDNRAVVSFAAFESAMLRLERANRRLWVIVLLLIVLLFGTNAAWLYYEHQFEDVVTETIETSTEGGGNAYGTLLSGDNNEVTYGASEDNAD